MKFFSILALLFCSALHAGPFINIEEKNELKIVTPSLSERKTAKIRLENGLEAYLISDPNVNEPGAALAVNTGSWDDPQDAHGLAHFCEHMLFMGTEKYPDEKEYHRYLDEHGGKNNAFTTNDRTVFMFSCNPEGFLGALDRFSQFFIAPLFNPSCIERERCAVNQEFEKNVPLDNWRILHVKKELANPEHPFHRFSIGNCKTLGHIKQDQIKSWYDQHYSANLMHLVVISKDSLESIQNHVTALFSPIKNRNFTPSHFEASLYPVQLAGHFLYIEPKQQVQKLELTWEIPSALIVENKVRAASLLSYVLGHEGEKTLLEKLKKDDLATGLSTHMDRFGFGQGVFSLSISLTTKGVLEKEKVIASVFEAIASYKNAALPSYIYDEIGKIEKMKYAYQQREETFDFVTELAYALVDESLETFPMCSLIPTQFEPGKVQELLALLTPEKALYTLTAPTTLTKVKSEQEENWLHVPYTLVSIEKEKLEEWNKIAHTAAIAHPQPNRFIPADLKLVGLDAVTTKPLIPIAEMALETKQGKVYFAKDDRFMVPKISWNFSFKTPRICDEDALSKAQADLFCKMLNRKLTPLIYEADLGGLSYSLDPFSSGLKLSLNGYHEKASEFLFVLLNEMRNLNPTEHEFELCKEEISREYHNKATKTPIVEAQELLSSLLYKHHAGVSSKLDRLEDLKYSHFVTFSKQLFNEGYLEATCFGNMTKEESVALFEKMVATIDFTPFSPENHFKVELANLSKTQEPCYIVKKSKLPGNVVLLLIDEDAFSFKRRSALDILSKGLEEPFFTELRTRQQTAYIVSNWSQEIERHLYSFFVIQSSTHDTRDLLARFELFFEEALHNLSESVVPSQRFELIRQATVETLLHGTDNMESTGKLLHTLAFDYDGQMDWLDRRVEGLKSLTYEEFKGFAQEFLGKENHKRFAVCINGSQEKGNSVVYKKHTNLDKIRQEISYKAREKAHKETASTIEPK